MHTYGCTAHIYANSYFCKCSLENGNLARKLFYMQRTCAKIGVLRTFRDDSLGQNNRA